MATLHYADAWAKAANDTPFRNRLRVALTRHCQYQIQRSRNVVMDGGDEAPTSESPERYEAMQSLARVVLLQVRQPDWLTSAGLYVLLPWASIDPDDDEALDGRIAAVFSELGPAPIPE